VSACEEHKKCINQLFRPKMAMPVWMRPKGMGDCTTCKPCENNTACTGFYPAPGLLIVTVGDEHAESDGDLDDNSGVCDGDSGDTPDFEVT